MATNLRLDERAVEALRAAAQLTGRSQQDILREAINRYLGLTVDEPAREVAVASGLVERPTPFVDVNPTVKLRRGRTTADLLDRDDER